MSISSTSLVFVALAACNGVLDLAPPIVDSDLDGISDATDNCPLDANPQQRDSNFDGLGDVCDCLTSGVDLDHDDIDDACDDCVGEAIGEDMGGDGIDDGCEACAGAVGADIDADGIDDACDPCTLGPPHDEDHDGVADACDNCPTQPNANEASVGAIGAACDRGLVGSTLFDPLVQQDLSVWQGIVDGWTWSNDELLVDGARERSTRVEIPRAFLVETRVETAGILSLQCVSPNSNSGCAFQQATRTLQMSQVSGLQAGLPVFKSASVPVPGSGRVRVQYRVDPLVPFSRCEALDDAGVVIASANLDDAVNCRRFKISSTTSSRLEYLWFIRN